jgi:hypothetical protein
MDVQLNTLRVSILHINRWSRVNIEACINPNFRPAAKQSLTIAVMTGLKDARIQAVSITVKVAELLARVKDQANGTDNEFPFSVLFFKLTFD